MLRKIFMKNDLSKERFRNEWKYLISTSEKELLELRMKHLLKKDPNAKGNGYMIRSLYFEDYFNSAYAEKESGVLMRKNIGSVFMIVVTVQSNWSGRNSKEEKRKHIQRDCDRCDRNTPDKLDGNQRGMSGNQLTDPYHEQGECR